MHIHSCHLIFAIWLQHAVTRYLPQISTKIIKGSSILIDEAPFMASVIYSGEHRCGGSILNKYQVITAAHCTKGRRPDQMTVRVGSTSRKFGGQVVGIMKIHQNPKFSYKDFDFDVSILDLNSTINFGATVAPIRLASRRQFLRPGTKAFIFGWGSVSVKNVHKTATQLRRGSIEIIGRNVCQKLFPRDLITDRMLCGGFLRGGEDTCYGDSGGPLVVDDVLVGITSWGHGCGNPNSLGVYSNVGALRFYIDEFIINK